MQCLICTFEFCFLLPGCSGFEGSIKNAHYQSPEGRDASRTGSCMEAGLASSPSKQRISSCRSLLRSWIAACILIFVFFHWCVHTCASSPALVLFIFCSKSILHAGLLKCGTTDWSLLPNCVFWNKWRYNLFFKLCFTEADIIALCSRCFQHVLHEKNHLAVFHASCFVKCLETWEFWKCAFFVLIRLFYLQGFFIKTNRCVWRET